MRHALYLKKLNGLYMYMYAHTNKEDRDGANQSKKHIILFQDKFIQVPPKS
jgi:hypothetical protein